MLTKIWVDGFRSLNDFTFEPKQGLNVLVGANGAGKTNIIDFLKFVSLLKDNTLSEATKKTENIFSNFHEIKNRIFVKIEGEENGENYDYTANIVLGENGINFATQHIESNLLKFLKLEQDHLNYATRKTNDGREFFSDTFDTYYHHSASIFAIFSSRFVTSTYKSIADELNFETPYNFNPAVIKRFDAIGTEPTITSEGEGLHAYLYKLQSQDKNTLALIQSYFSYLRDDIIEFKTEKDEVRNCFVTYAIFKNSKPIPITHLSDGTVKWLALIAAVFSKQPAFVIDEPENHLHPRLQSVFIEALREEFSEPNKMAIIATHSETLLNAVRPEEIVIITAEDGKTKAERPTDILHLNQLLDKHGFGLGHAYVSGWL